MDTPYPLRWRTTAQDTHRRLVSYSEIRSLDCWLKHHLRYERGLEPIVKFEALNFGTAWDAFMDEWWAPQVFPEVVNENDRAQLDTFAAFLRIAGTPDQPKPPTSEVWKAYARGGPLPTRLERSLAAGGAALQKEARRVDAILLERNMPRPFGWGDELQRMRDLLVGMGFHYAERYGDEPEWRTVAQQAHFEVPFPSLSGSGRRSTRYWLHGKIDRIMQHVPSGGYFIVDAKSAKAVDANYRIGYETDRQLPLYAWALRELGWPITGTLPDAAAKLLPHWPEMLKVPKPVLDFNGDPVMTHEPCPACEGDGRPGATFEEREQHEYGRDLCPKCNGDGAARYASGARKGEVKMRKVTRPALQSMLDANGGSNYVTTYDIMIAAIDANDLDPADYERELDLLLAEKMGDAHSPFFWRPDDLLLTDAVLDEAANSLRLAMPYLDKLPPLAMSDPMKCRMCSFKHACANRDRFEEVLAQEFVSREQRHAARDAAPPVAATDSPF